MPSFKHLLLRFSDWKTIDDLAKWVVDQAIAVYQGAETRNDFFLLHAVTSSWSLRQLLKVDLPEADAIEILVHFLCAFMAFYLVQRRPKILVANLKTPDVSSVSWDTIIKMALEKDVDCTDEHIYKLVQVCHEQSKSNDDSDTHVAGLYKRAAITALSTDLAFFPPSESRW